MAVGSGSTNFLSWLTSSIQEANKAAKRHSMLKEEIRELQSALEDRYQLKALQVGVC